jgi:hypothetical protein
MGAVSNTISANVPTVIAANKAVRVLIVRDLAMQDAVSVKKGLLETASTLNGSLMSLSADHKNLRQ